MGLASTGVGLARAVSVAVARATVTPRSAHRPPAPTAWLAYSTHHGNGRTTAQLTELCAAERDTASCAALMLELLRRLHEADADLVSTLAVPGTPLFAWFRRIGFLRGPSFGVQLVPL